MATSLLQIRVDDNLKDEAAVIFENLGIDTSTAIRMFLKRAVLENGIPFRMTLPREPYRAERGYQAMMDLSAQAENSGTSGLSLEVINAEIAEVREKNRTGK